MQKETQFGLPSLMTKTTTIDEMDDNGFIVKQECTVFIKDNDEGYERIKQVLVFEGETILHALGRVAVSCLEEIAQITIRTELWKSRDDVWSDRTKLLVYTPR